MVLRFHSKLYSLETLQEAARQYAQVATLSVEPGPVYHQVSLETRGAKAGLLADEFANYALALMKA